MTTITGSEFKMKRPAAGTLWVTGWHCLKSETGVAKFSVENDSADPRAIHVSRNKRRVLEALISGPMYCASPCRLSHYVQLLRDEHGLDIENGMVQQ